MIEMMIITVLVLWSALVVFKKVFPSTAKKTFNAMAQSCEKQGWHSLSKWLAPKVPTGCGGGCGCGSENDSSNAKSTAPVEVQSVKWK